ncbi:MAG: hypothetical protein IPP33_05815 [Flavobacteriales bacterium]|nr:hypothetical protein [Flavobacteriales bacterium]
MDKGRRVGREHFDHFTPILGFDTIPFVLLSFEQSFRQLNDDRTLVGVSGSGGTD